MSSEEQATVEGLLERLGRGDKGALDELFPIVHGTLRRIAHHHLRGERPGHTLSTTALVNESYLKLLGVKSTELKDRGHFLAVASQAMRRILVDYAVRRRAKKRADGRSRVELDEGLALADDRIDDVLQVDELLGRLEKVDRELARLVECRVFGGLTLEETAAALDVSTATVKRRWQLARAWLGREMRMIMPEGQPQ